MDHITVPIDKQWLSVAEVASYMGVSAHVVTSMLRAGEVPGVKFGREWRVARVDLESYLNRGQKEVAVTTKPLDAPVVDTDVKTDLPWQVIVWNDPVNLMDYVVFVLRKLFGHSLEEATRLMLAVHNEGRASVSQGPREQAEMDCYRLHQYGLWATVEQ